MKKFESFEEMLEDYLPESAERGEEVLGTLIRKERDFSYMTLEGKSLDGVVRTNEVENYEINSEFKVVILEEDEENDCFKVSRKKNRN